MGKDKLPGINGVPGNLSLCTNTPMRAGFVSKIPTPTTDEEQLVNACAGNYWEPD